MDNCWRENKNKFVLAYLSFLVQQGKFDYINVNFFTVGHTHSDPDQLFSRISIAMHQRHVFTLQDMKETVRTADKNNTMLYFGYIENFPNISGMMEKSNWLNPITGHTDPHVFCISKHQDHDMKVGICYKSFMRDRDYLNKRNPFFLLNGTVKFDFNHLRMCNFKPLPEDFIKNVFVSLNACKSRIKNDAKFESLMNLANTLKTPEDILFNWDMGFYHIDYVYGEVSRQTGRNSDHLLIDEDEEEEDGDDLVMTERRNPRIVEHDDGDEDAEFFSGCEDNDNEQESSNSSDDIIEEINEEGARNRSVPIIPNTEISGEIGLNKKQKKKLTKPTTIEAGKFVIVLSSLFYFNISDTYPT